MSAACKISTNNSKLVLVPGEKGDISKISVGTPSSQLGQKNHIGGAASIEPDILQIPAGKQIGKEPIVFDFTEAEYPPALSSKSSVFQEFICALSILSSLLSKKNKGTLPYFWAMLVLCALNALVAASDALESAIPKLEQMISSDENDLRAAVQEVEDVGNANAQLEIREIALFGKVLEEKRIRKHELQSKLDQLDQS